MQATSVWASNVASSTPAERMTQGMADGLVQLLAGLQPAVPLGHRGVIGELALEDVAAQGGQAAGRPHDDVASRLAGQLGGGLVDGEAERLEEERQVDVRAGLGDLDEQLLLLRGVVGIGVVVEQQLDSVGAHALGLAHAPVRQQATDPGGRRPRVAAGLDGHDEAGGCWAASRRVMAWAAPSSGSSRMPLAVVMMARTTARLASTSCSYVTAAGIVRAEHAAQVVAVVERQDRQPARVGGAGIQSSHGADPQRHRSTPSLCRGHLPAVAASADATIP